MCFSPAVSFTASAGLAVIGTLCLRKATSKKERFFASIPILFALQQFMEGMLWLVLMQGEQPALQYWLTQGYAAFAGIVWPTFGAFSLWKMESSSKRKLLMLGIMAVGGGIALYTLNGILHYGITARIAEHCILYEYPVEQGYTMLIAYIIATCAAFFVATDHRLQWIGVVNIFAFVIAYRFYHYHLVSIWCFFAAAVSATIYLHFSHLRKSETAAELACSAAI